MGATGGQLRQRHFPSAILVGLRVVDLLAKNDSNLLTGRRGAPHGHLAIPLQYHVVSEDPREPGIPVNGARQQHCHEHQDPGPCQSMRCLQVKGDHGVAPEGVETAQGAN